MDHLTLVLIGFGICLMETLVIFLLFYVIDFEDYALYFWYSSCILLINILPAIFIALGEPLFWANYIKTMFAISSLFAILNVIILFISFNTRDHCFKDSMFDMIVSFGVEFCIIIIIIIVLIITPNNNAIKEEQTAKISNPITYVDYYEIPEENGIPSIYYMSNKEEKDSYYVIEYKYSNENGLDKLSIIQLSPQNVDVVLAVEDQDRNYFIVTTTEKKKNNSSESSEPIIEKEYSYTISLKNTSSINLIPITN